MMPNTVEPCLVVGCTPIHRVLAHGKLDYHHYNAVVARTVEETTGTWIVTRFDLESRLCAIGMSISLNPLRAPPIMPVLNVRLRYPHGKYQKHTTRERNQQTTNRYTELLTTSHRRQLPAVYISDAH